LKKSCGTPLENSHKTEESSERKVKSQFVASVS